jgi:formylglycine-generating enzyme required for sulfatase activity
MTFLVACSNKSVDIKLPLSITPELSVSEVISREIAIQDTSVVTNVIRGAVISSTVYQANQIQQHTETTTVSNTLSIQQSMLLETGKVLQKALEVNEDVTAAIALFHENVDKAIAIDPTNEDAVRLLADDVLRDASHQLVRVGEQLAATSNYKEAVVYFSTAIALDPPPDALLYVYVPRGEFISNPDDFGYTENVNGSDRTGFTNGFWIMRTEVTNAQYKECVDAGQCLPPDGILATEWTNESLAKQPVNILGPNLMQDYANWAGGRLPTGDEWEKACRGTDGRMYPWGNEDPTAEYANYMNGVLTDVGAYPQGASAYGLYDMAGNAWESVAIEGDSIPLFMGGSTEYDKPSLRCTLRTPPIAMLDFFSFRIVIPEP